MKPHSPEVDHSDVAIKVAMKDFVESHSSLRKEDFVQAIRSEAPLDLKIRFENLMRRFDSRQRTFVTLDRNPLTATVLLLRQQGLPHLCNRWGVMFSTGLLSDKDLAEVPEVFIDATRKQLDVLV